MVRKIFIMICAVTELGCYVPPSSSGVTKVVSLQEDKNVKCCFIVNNLDTGLKDYDCHDLRQSECSSLNLKGKNK